MRNARFKLANILSDTSRVVYSTNDGDQIMKTLPVLITLLLVPSCSPAQAQKSSSIPKKGRFELRGIAPGDYKLFSWEEVEPGAWEDPEFLRDFETKGEKISLQEGEQKTIDLTAIQTSTPESAKP
jgi:hypothetical protein